MASGLLWFRLGDVCLQHFTYIFALLSHTTNINSVMNIIWSVETLRIICSCIYTATAGELNNVQALGRPMLLYRVFYIYIYEFFFLFWTARKRHMRGLWKGRGTSRASDTFIIMALWGSPDLQTTLCSR